MQIDDEGVGAPLRDRAGGRGGRVGERASSLGVEGGGDDLGRFGVEIARQHTAAVQRSGSVTRFLACSASSAGGAAVAVEGVGDPPHRGAELGRCRDAGVVDELAFDAPQHLGAFGGVGVGDLLDVRPGHVAGGERVGELGERVELAGDIDGAAGLPGRHAARVTQRRRRW